MTDWLGGRRATRGEESVARDAPRMTDAASDDPRRGASTAGVHPAAEMIAREERREPPGGAGATKEHGDSNEDVRTATHSEEDERSDGRSGGSLGDDEDDDGDDDGDNDGSNSPDFEFPAASAAAAVAPVAEGIPLATSVPNPNPNPNPPEESAPSESASRTDHPGTLARLQRLAAVATGELANLRDELAHERKRVREYAAKLTELRRSTRTMGETAQAKALAATDAINAAVNARDVAEAALRTMGAEVEAAKLANELVRAAEEGAKIAEDRAIAAESRAATAEARAVRAEADAERAACEVRAARREVSSMPKLDTDEVRALVRAAEERAADAEERAAHAEASTASARSALLESNDAVARLEARLAKCRADAVQRAGREGRRDFNRGPGADRGDGCGRSPGDEKTFASSGVDEEKRGRAERRDALVRALDATRGRLRELQLRDAGGDGGALSRFKMSRFRDVSTPTPTKKKAPDPTDRFRPSPQKVRPGTD